MSREQYRARSKKVQKLGRDGLVEQDKATGQEKRISQRTADVSFGPRQSQDQAADRVSSQRTPTNAPTQGKRRKQPRPSPPQEPVQSAAVDESSVPGMLDLPDAVPIIQQADTMPTIRQAGDAPLAAPPLQTDGTSSSKHRQQKRANRLNQDAPTSFIAEDSTDRGRLHFEPRDNLTFDANDAAGATIGADEEPLPEKSEPTAPHGVDDVPMRGRPADRPVRSPTHRRAEDGGRLRFEPEPELPPDHTDIPHARTSPPRKQATAPTDRPGGGSAPLKPRPANSKRGRLQFEAERTPPPDVTDIRTRRVAEANAPATPQQPGDTHVPEYEATSTMEHGDTSAPISTDDPAAGLTRRQRKQYEKAERRVEQSSQRLEKAQAKLPTRLRAHLQKEYDANTDKVRRRLRFETEVKPEVVKPSIPAQVGRTAKTAAVMKLHGKIRENERDNVALEAAHKTEFTAEQGTGRFLRWNKQRLRSKPYRAVRQAEHRLTVDNTRLTWQTALRDNPDLRRKNVLSKWVQKQKIKRKYAQAAREARRTAQHTQEVLSTTGKIVRAVQQFAAAHKSALLIVALLTLVVAMFSAGLASWYRYAVRFPVLGSLRHLSGR